MTTNVTTRRLILITLTGLVASCSGPPTSQQPPAQADAQADRLVVYVVNYPLQYFAERIGGNHVQVEFPAPPGDDPALWSPDVETVAAYQKADLILRNGAGYARWVDRVTLPPSRIVDTSAGFQERYVHVDDTVTHSHGPQGDHSQGEIAFTTWLDPTLAVRQARAIHQAFLRARPVGEAAFRTGLESLEKDLLDLHRRIAELVASAPETPLLTSHPVYQYLARQYGMRMASVHFEPGADPDAKRWRDLAALQRRHPARWMLWEAPPLAETADRLRGLGVQSIVFRPCGNRPPEGDYLEVMSRNLQDLARAF